MKKNKSLSKREKFLNKKDKFLSKKNKSLSKKDKSLSKKNRKIIQKARRCQKFIRLIKGKVYNFCFPSKLSNIFSNKSYFERNVLMKALTNNDSDMTSEKADLEDQKQVKSKKTLDKKTVLFDKLMTIRVKPNNMFCTLTSTKKKRVISATSTKYRIKMSKKALRYNYKLILKAFIEETKKFFGKKMRISLSAPRRIRRELFRILKKKLTLKKKFLKNALGKLIPVIPRVLVFHFKAKKCFNGCRARKKKRSKQRGLRIYK